MVLTSRWTLAAAGALLIVILASPRTARAADDELSLDLGPGGSLELRRIPKGTFIQGSPTNEPGRENDEVQRNVTISKSFWLGKIPITRAQFSRFVTETRHVTDAEKGLVGGFGFDTKQGTLAQKKEFTWRNPGFPQKDEDPVVLVTFGDANAFIAWVSRKTGRRVRLPTEAEFEYATRANTTTAWYGATKEEDAISLGWFKTNSNNSTHPVATRRPNAFGLFDMSGNIFQWCRDIYAPYPAGDVIDPENTTIAPSPAPPPPPVASGGAPIVPIDPEKRVLRGGSWFRDPKRSRSAARHKASPGQRNADNGFRIAVDDDGSGGATPSTSSTSEATPLGSASAVDGGAVVATATALPLRTASGEGGGSGWLLLVAPAFGATIAVAWVLARRGSSRKRQPSSPEDSLPTIATRLQDDGFWIRTSLPRGTRVRYTCIVNGRGADATEIAMLVGTETFIQTGGKPTALKIREVIPPPSRPSVPSDPSSSSPRPSGASPFAAPGPSSGTGPVANPFVPRPPTPFEVQHPQSESPLSPAVAHTFISASNISTAIPSAAPSSVPLMPVVGVAAVPPPAPSSVPLTPFIGPPTPASSIPLTPIAPAPVSSRPSGPPAPPPTPPTPAAAMPPSSIASIPLTLAAAPIPPAPASSPSPPAATPSKPPPIPTAAASAPRPLAIPAAPSSSSSSASSSSKSSNAPRPPSMPSPAAVKPTLTAPMKPSAPLPPAVPASSSTEDAKAKELEQEKQKAKEKEKEKQKEAEKKSFAPPAPISSRNKMEDGRKAAELLEREMKTSDKDPSPEKKAEPVNKPEEKPEIEAPKKPEPEIKKEEKKPELEEKKPEPEVKKPDEKKPEVVEEPPKPEEKKEEKKD